MKKETTDVLRTRGRFIEYLRNQAATLQGFLSQGLSLKVLGTGC